jgi:hypothetical protein
MPTKKNANDARMSACSRQGQRARLASRKTTSGYGLSGSTARTTGAAKSTIGTLTVAKASAAPYPARITNSLRASGRSESSHSSRDTHKNKYGSFTIFEPR